MGDISIKAHHHTIVPPLHTYFIEVHLPLIDRLVSLNPVQHPLMVHMFDTVRYIDQITILTLADV
ncbi:uncharacterized protein G2W53_034180 [Senna tora]|uniref:Uncharacterized protein n=1 Tax=Senna tora TaxID=362788 RepID=A0A834SZV2_9FABA|nr:uncharacterized protein G2W53_034180 [Senna tora]